MARIVSGFLVAIMSSHIIIEQTGPITPSNSSLPENAHTPKTMELGQNLSKVALCPICAVWYVRVDGEDGGSLIHRRPIGFPG